MTQNQETAPVERPDFSAMQFRHDGPWLVRLFDPCRTFTPDVWVWVGAAFAIWCVCVALAIVEAVRRGGDEVMYALWSLLAPQLVFIARRINGRCRQWIPMSWKDPLESPMALAVLGAALAALPIDILCKPLACVAPALAGFIIILLSSRKWSPRAPLSQMEQLERWIAYERANPGRKPKR